MCVCVEVYVRAYIPLSTSQFAGSSCKNFKIKIIAWLQILIKHIKKITKSWLRLEVGV